MANDDARPALTLEQQTELAIRMEGIFLLHARKQRDARYAEDPDPRFVHYTSAENALSIINSKRLWMRNATCMSDYSEVQHGFDILARFFSDKPRLDAFTAALDQCVPGAAMEAINLFSQWCDTTRRDTFISSISEHRAAEDFHGRLSMWRAFGNSSARVAIVFRIPKASRSKFVVQPCCVSY